MTKISRNRDRKASVLRIMVFMLISMQIAYSAYHPGIARAEAGTAEAAQEQEMPQESSESGSSEAAESAAEEETGPAGEPAEDGESETHEAASDEAVENENEDELPAGDASGAAAESLDAEGNPDAEDNNEDEIPEGQPGTEDNTGAEDGADIPEGNDATDGASDTSAPENASSGSETASSSDVSASEEEGGEGGENEEETASGPDAGSEESVSGATSTVQQATTTDVASVAATTTDTFAHPTSTDPAGTEGTPTIISGDAAAVANILNLVNTTLVNSEGHVFFSNLFDDIQGDIDYRQYLSSTSTICGLLACSGDSVQINLLNDAYIKNLIRLQAVTGGNLIEGGSTSTISTGDAFAGLNLVNIANASFIDSKYLLVTLNAFKSIYGDIILPSLADFFDNRPVSTISHVDLAGGAEVINELDLRTETGGNMADAGNASVQTGDAGSMSNLLNQINTALVGGGELSILLRVHGAWSGEIFGTPEGFEWTGSGGTWLLSRALGAGSGQASITGTSTVSIHNDIGLVAVTGENAITGAETALITTGDAFAGVNLVNIANASVIGRNWLLAIINVFGDLDGHVSFGRPDLWIGESVAAPDTVTNGSELTYTFTILNNGDLPATKITLMDHYDEAHLDIIESSESYSASEAGILSWTLKEPLAPGESMEVSYRARVKDAANGTDITNMVQVRAREPDNNLEDNTDTATVRVGSNQSGGNGSGNNGNGNGDDDDDDGDDDGGSSSGSSDNQPAGGDEGADQDGEKAKDDSDEGSDGERTMNPSEAAALPMGALEDLAVTRVVPSATLPPLERVVKQELIIRNTTGMRIEGVVLHDILRDPRGNVIGDEAWELGTVLPHEEIAVGYDITFRQNAPAGRYELSTTLSAPGDEAVTFNANGVIILNQPTTSEESLLPAALGNAGGDLTPSRSADGGEVLGSFTEMILPVAEAATNQQGGENAAKTGRLPWSMVFLSLLVGGGAIWFIHNRSRNS